MLELEQYVKEILPSLQLNFAYSACSRLSEQLLV